MTIRSRSVTASMIAKPPHANKVMAPGLAVGRSASGKPQNVTARPSSEFGGGQSLRQSKYVAPMASTSSLGNSKGCGRILFRAPVSNETWQVYGPRGPDLADHFTIVDDGVLEGFHHMVGGHPDNAVGEAQKEAGATIDTPGPTRRRVMPDYGTGNFQREVRHGFRQGQFGRAAFQMNPLLTEAADGQTTFRQPGNCSAMRRRGWPSLRSPVTASQKNFA